MDPIAVKRRTDLGDDRKGIVCVNMETVVMTVRHTNNHCILSVNLEAIAFDDFDAVFLEGKHLGA
jgi:hypothetical protein